ncbi:MAG: hypothetical protein ACPGNT_06720 [Rhodospirillales bacterium]
MLDRTVIDLVAQAMRDVRWDAHSGLTDETPLYRQEDLLTQAALMQCALCQKALGDCAMVGARAGQIEQGLALQICQTMGELTETTLRLQWLGASRHLAWVFCGPSEQRRRQAEHRVETQQALWERL